ncbi:glycosyltransferase family 2 protein [Rathayibacter tritici]|uniref:Glycosyl transferase n=1 Tax=Rathayibacter tritici TaxID=33888 RepID=A0A160KRG6_9MICO|nr:glycosyltransferase [Rathayibacter tritici]AND16023.1 glycosyl transferase [Rathayibacter tritici]PPF29968.1 glycosyltransferase family 2 protein [Rathayibacter tritici]PPF68663.1 glycosyltransferase family 2 protein [Rathayibacter tritici]PPG07371.1 glycosyltransferase family 2 protein [Rathayibacter tritici]PPI11985.1 glycosyltransferase family 2 protein [Rathayibacter tritici]
MSAPEPRVGVVVLTQGTRPEDLAAGLASVLAQEGVALDVVCVGNGWEPEGLPDAVRAVALPENLGIPAGRNAGVDAVEGDYLFFLDDDARVPSPRFLLDAVALLSSNRRIGLVQPRVDSTDGSPSPRRWIPRILKGDPRRSGPVFSVWEGAVVLRRDVFTRAGGWAAPFFYAHEGIELAWRVWDTGRAVWYAGELVAQHPVIQPTRHADYYRLNARNRVWLARRNLAVPLAVAYVASWSAIQCLRWRGDPVALRAWFAGWREGWRRDPGGRRVLSPRTVLRMAFAGRPPIV